MNPRFTYQGPLVPGGVRLVRCLRQALAEGSVLLGDEFDEFEFQAVGLYSSEYRSFQCTRRFIQTKNEKNRLQLKPTSWDTVSHAKW